MRTNELCMPTSYLAIGKSISFFPFLEGDRFKFNSLRFLINRNVSIKKVGVELKPIPFDELPPNVQEWLESEEYEEMGTSLPSYEDMYPSRKRKFLKRAARE